jgi:alpha-D-xyloside xylohydrolase
MVSKAVYEGQREATNDKRVCILTRSAFSGQQRYGVINWSGDIGGDWDTYRRQIVAGLNFTITGLPYWTTDIGGFFRPGQFAIHRRKFHELLTRWFQWSVFNPIFRMHGYMTETEPWKYGQTVEDNMRKMLNLRYQLAALHLFRSLASNQRFNHDAPIGDGFQRRCRSGETNLLNSCLAKHFWLRPLPKQV